MEVLKQIPIPVIADYVLSPEFFYGEMTGIYFKTEDEQYGRITFENLDAVKICRGEMLPYPFDYATAKPHVWIYQVENSKWQKERYDYENKHYGEAYEFGGSIEEMLTDFKHYLFVFHDQFIEVIARGFWFEKSESTLFGKALIEGHPFLPLPLESVGEIKVAALTTKIRKNPKPISELLQDVPFCSQKLYEFAMEINGKDRVMHTVVLSCRKGKVISTLRGYFGRQEIKVEGIMDLEEALPYVENYMSEVVERREAMNKKAN